MSPLPVPGPSSITRKEPIKFSALAHPPSANLLPPAALLSLLCLAFTCLLFVCFRHVGWIMTIRAKSGEMIESRLTSLQQYCRNLGKGGQIKLPEEEQSVALSAGDPLHGLHRGRQSLDTESNDDEDDEVLPQVPPLL